LILSHITEVETQIKDLVCLQETLKELGYAYTVTTAEQKVRIRGWNGVEEEADMVINTKSLYDIGMRLKLDGTYEFIADWWGVESHAGFTQEEFTQKVLQKYSYNKVISEEKARGFDVVEEEQAEDQTLKVVVRKWA